MRSDQTRSDIARHLKTQNSKLDWRKSAYMDAGVDPSATASNKVPNIKHRSPHQIRSDHPDQTRSTHVGPFAIHARLPARCEATASALWPWPSLLADR